MTRFEMAALVAWRTLGSSLDDTRRALNAGLHDEAVEHLDTALHARRALRDLGEDLPVVFRRELFRIRRALASDGRPDGAKPSR